MTNPTIVCPVKMEYGWNFSIFSLKMIVTSGLEKILLKFLHALTMLFLLLNLYFWSKFRPLFIIIFWPEMLKFHPYSILTGQTMVRFVIYCVLIRFWIFPWNDYYCLSLTQDSQSESKCELVNFIENSGLSNNMGIQLQAANLMETLWFRGKDDTNLPQHPGKGGWISKDIFQFGHILEDGPNIFGLLRIS